MSNTSLSFKDNNMLTNNTRTEQTISISQLQLGMYVKAIFKNNGERINSEGYILASKSIDNLHSAGVEELIIVPEKTKKVEKVDKVFNDIVVTLPKHENTITESSAAEYKKSNITLEQELSTASKLYQATKSIQEKIIASIKQKEQLKVTEIIPTTDAIVTSIFRNQDALSCLSRINDKGSYLMGHSTNVAILMTIFAKHLAIARPIIEQLALGAFLHDIGKILLPSELLTTTKLITETEQNILNGHVKLGMKVLEATPSISHIAVKIVNEHHERLDGSGFPLGLKGKQIDLYSRMIAIVDRYDAMISGRPNRKPMFPINAFKTLVNEAPDKLDEELIEKFIQCIGIYPVGTLVKLNSGKIGLISKINNKKPLHPHVKIFYNARLSQAVAIEEIDLSRSKYKDQIDCCIRPDDFNLDLLAFFKMAFGE
jgi:HD-GYP domain-containing protein (c-di-GMP phosphodiesterase class II)